MTRRLSVHREQWPLKAPFRITGRTWTDLDVIVVEITDGRFVGRGEAAGVYYLGESSTTMYQQVLSVAPEIERGAGREELLEMLPAGGARNAVDCALWDLEAHRCGRPVWDLAGVSPRPLTTVMSIGVRDTAEEMAEIARGLQQFPVLKIKLDAVDPIERVTAIRAARPTATLVVDANQGFSFELLREVLPAFDKLGVAMLEQPLPRGADERLQELDPPLPLCADESCLHLGELANAAERYQMVNIKLDKSGGLTEALRMVDRARQLSLPLMVGNMFGTSLAMAPGFLVGQTCRFVDLDGPLSLVHDRPFGMRYDSGTISLPAVPPWGSGCGAVESLP